MKNLCGRFARNEHFSNILSRQKKKKKGKKSGDVPPRSQPAAVYGVDCLRLWVAAHASQSSSILAGEGIFEQTKHDLDRIRLIFR